VWKDEIRPDYIATDDAELLSLSETLIEAFERHVGKARHELETELKELLGTGTEFLLQRGLAKLLWDRCEFEPGTQIDPFALRQSLFARAAKSRLANGGHLKLDDIHQQIAEEFQLDQAAQVQRVLYADLKEEQHLQEFKKVKPDWLLKRYNVALAQAVLFRAVKLTIRVANQPMARYRVLFRRIKFFQLMYQVKGNAKEGYELELDGPVSLFKSCQKYGLQMANFLPTLLHCSEWSLTATVQWGKARLEKQFSLSHEQGLEPSDTARDSQHCCDPHSGGDHTPHAGHLTTTLWPSNPWSQSLATTRFRPPCVPA
jgi:predicted nuclease of restriction endonuclease-like RecB superfamily